jgi:hypothetical protein
MVTSNPIDKVGPVARTGERKQVRTVGRKERPSDVGVPLPLFQPS